MKRCDSDEVPKAARGLVLTLFDPSLETTL